MDLFKQFSFEAAHRLPNVAPDHKCARMQGHSFAVEVRLRGLVDERLGWVVDFGDVKKAVQPVIDLLDHQNLNEIEGLSNPTSENLARWLWARLSAPLPMLYEIVVRETPTSGCIFRGPAEEPR